MLLLQSYVLYKNGGVKVYRKRKKILFLVDNHNWCWTNQANNIAKWLPEFDSMIVPAKEFTKNHAEILPSCDLVYMRGYPHGFLKNIGNINKPFIFTLSTGGTNLQMRIKESLKYKKNAIACVTQNEVAERAARKHKFNNVKLIPCGIDTETFKPSKTEYEYVVGFAGNSRGKRGDLKGATLVREACRSMGITYREVNRDNKLSPNEMPGFYKSLMIYAQPSEAEGCSNSVMEAMATGLPCLIVKDIGYHGEICKHNKNIFFVERNLDSMRNAIKTLIIDDKTRERISKGSRMFAEQHKWMNIIDKYRKLINEVI